MSDTQVLFKALRDAHACPHCGELIEAYTLKASNEVVSSSQELYDLIAPYTRLLDHEEFFAILVDVKNRPRKIIQVAIGSVAQCPVTTQAIFKEAILEGATNIMVAHNHPSGDPTPSPEDDKFTRILYTASRYLGIKLLDHVVCGATSFTSYADSGKLRQYEAVLSGNQQTCSQLRMAGKGAG